MPNKPPTLSIILGFGDNGEEEDVSSYAEGTVKPARYATGTRDSYGINDEQRSRIRQMAKDSRGGRYRDPRQANLSSLYNSSRSRRDSDMAEARVRNNNRRVEQRIARTGMTTQQMLDAGRTPTPSGPPSQSQLDQWRAQARQALESQLARLGNNFAPPGRSGPGRWVVTDNEFGWPMVTWAASPAQPSPGTGTPATPATPPTRTDAVAAKQTAVVARSPRDTSPPIPPPTRSPRDTSPPPPKPTKSPRSS